jgi:hypothetical protein
VGNWRTVNMTGTMTGEDAALLRAYLGYSFRERNDPAMKRFGPLSFCREQPSICGLNAWPAPEVARSGNLAERDYGVDDVAEHLRELVAVAGSMMLTVHCGGERESLDCVATIRVGEGLVAAGKPEVERLAEIGDEQMLRNFMTSLHGEC